MKRFIETALRWTILLHLVVSEIDSSAPLDLLNVTIPQLIAALNNGKITANQLTQLYLNRIDKVNLKGPALHAILETNPDALSIASRLDHAKIRKGKLHGISILLKDNIATDDRMNTTAGSYALLGSKAPCDAFVVQQLRRAGAIILGKTTMSEWAGFRSLGAMRNGVSGRGGISNSAYVTNGDPLGSSSGSAIAVSIGLCSAALGTETDGSIIGPASRNGIVGIKPTVGLTSRSNVIPISSRQDSVGALGRTVVDVALVLEVIQGMDPKDNLTRRICAENNYTRFLSGTHGFKNMRLGVLRPESPSDDAGEQVLREFNRAIQLMRQHGATVNDPVAFSNMDAILNGTAEFMLLVGEFKQNIEKYFSTLANTEIRTLRNLIDFNTAHKEQEFSSYLPDQDIFLMAENMTSVTAEQEAEYIRLSKSLDQTMDKYHLDAIVTIAEYTTSPSAISAAPIITVPLGYLQLSEGLQPFGIAFMGRAGSEGILLQLAHAFEQATHVRDQVRPKYAPA